MTEQEVILAKAKLQSLEMILRGKYEPKPVKLGEFVEHVTVSLFQKHFVVVKRFVFVPVTTACRKC